MYTIQIHNLHNKQFAPIVLVVHFPMLAMVSVTKAIFDVYYDNGVELSLDENTELSYDLVYLYNNKPVIAIEFTKNSAEKALTA